MRASTPALIAIFIAGLMSAPGSAVGSPNVQAIVFDPTAPSTIYVGTEDGLLISDDAGSTWTGRPLNPRQQVHALAIDPHDPATIWAATDVDLRRSHDRGITWTTMKTSAYTLPLTVRRFANASDLYSEDLERAAKEFSQGRYRFSSVIVSHAPEPIVLAGAVGVLRSADDGVHWTRMPIVGEHHRSYDNQGIEQLVADPHDMRMMWAVSECRVLTSHDAGMTWRKPARLPGSPCITSLTVDPSGAATVYAGTVDNGVLRSLDGGTSWTHTGGELATAQIRLVALGTHGTLYATVQDRGLFASTDGGQSWTQSLPGTRNNPLAVTADPRDPATLWAGCYHGLWKTTDGGTHWVSVLRGPSSLPPRAD